MELRGASGMSVEWGPDDAGRLTRRAFLRRAACAGGLAAFGLVGADRVLPAAEEAPRRKPAHRVWIDTDIGDDIDDAVGLLVAARHPALRLVGVSTVHGRVEIRAWLARELLKRARVDVPVLPGAMASLRGDEVTGAPASYDRLAPKLEVPVPRDDDARVERIAQAMERIEPGFHLVTIGAITNAAKLLERHPKLARSWKSVTCMAGRLEGGPEWNVQCDPQAAQRVCRDLTPRLVGLEACSDTLPRAEVEALVDRSDAASAFFLECYAAYRRQEDSPLTLYDPISLLSLVRPDAFDLQSMRVTVDDKGRMRPADEGSAITYARKSDWGAIRPVIEGVLRGSP